MNGEKLPEKCAAIYGKVVEQIGEELGKQLVPTVDSKREELILTPQIDFAPFEKANIATVIQKLGGSYVNKKVEGRDAGYYYVPLALAMAAPAEEQPAAEEPAAPQEPEQPKKTVLDVLNEQLDAIKSLKPSEKLAMRINLEKLRLFYSIEKSLALIAKDSAMSIKWKEQQEQSTASRDAAPQDTAPRTIEDLTFEVRNALPEDLEAMLQFEVKGTWLLLKPKQFLGSENFAKIASSIRGLGGEYISAGKDSHFRLAVPMPDDQPQQPQGTPVQRSTRPTQGIEQDGIIWIKATNQRDEEYLQALVKDNGTNPKYFELESEIAAKVAEGKKGLAKNDKWYWLSQRGDYIGQKPAKKFGSRKK